ncbi:MAG: hypothetical protein EVA87_00120 [Rhodospirillaceae bacterium]|nr:hypothetical protein [Rhodospirillaceae bacterium]RPF95357.1 MAG: hypothetical protein CBC23_012445 [Rhodospirillaceae bacterium TMED63]RZO38641.1 MAG: hypothetical protein EVA87_00120 [Rhodospirillaceae bacterium]
MKNFFAEAMAAFFVSRAPAQPAPVQIEIMAILDSFHTNSNAKTGWVQNFIDQTLRADGGCKLGT